MNTRKDRFTAVHAFLLIEFVALLIGVAMAITPSKTGSDSSIADYFFDEPTFLQEFAINFLFTNAILLVLAIGFWSWSKLKREKQS